MELDNQGLQAQLADTTTKMENASAAHAEAAAGAAELRSALEEAQRSGSAASAELSACTAKVGWHEGLSIRNYPFTSTLRVWLCTWN